MDYPYLALLRGINVGGKNMIKMLELKVCLEAAGLKKVRTYIQTGNIFFTSSETDTQAMAENVKATLAATFQLQISTVIFSYEEWKQIIEKAPKNWGKDPNWKHNLLILLKPYDMDEVVSAIGTLKPEIETLTPGEGVLYQSMSRDLFGRTTTGKLASNPTIYQRMTIRNYNTSLKLLSLFS